MSTFKNAIVFATTCCCTCVSPTLVGAAEAAAAEAAAVLDPAAFDAVKVNAMIAASTLDDATPAPLKAGVDAAATNPALVQGAIDAVKAAMGM